METHNDTPIIGRFVKDSSGYLERHRVVWILSTLSC